MIANQKSSVLGCRIRWRLNALVSAEIGALAPMSDKFTHVRSSGMAPSSRDRIAAELNGLIAVLFERAMATGVSQVSQELRERLPPDQESAAITARLTRVTHRRRLRCMRHAAGG
jgi:hypothetical protein